MNGMKFIPLFLAAAAFWAVSCEKEMPQFPDRPATEVICGKYNCISMKSLDIPLDLDGDGVCHFDLMEEFSAFSYAKLVFSMPSFIHAPFGHETEAVFSLSIPTQCVKYDKSSHRFSLLADLCGGKSYLYYSYSVREDGSFMFSVRDAYRLDYLYDFLGNPRLNDFEIRYIDEFETRGGSVVDYTEGFLIVEMVGAYYDFNTESFVKVPVELLYKRVLSI